MKKFFVKEVNETADCGQIRKSNQEENSSSIITFKINDENLRLVHGSFE